MVDAKKRVVGLAMFAVLAMFFAACGDDDDSGSGEDTNGTDERNSPELGGEAVKLMVLAPTGSTVGQNYPDFEAAAKAAALAVEADGGINGHPVEIVYCNDRNDPNEAEACAREAVDERVTAVIGAFTRFGASYLPVLEEAGIPSLGNDLLSPDDFANPMSFPFGGGQLSYLGSTPFALAEEGATSVAIMRTDIEAAANVSGLVQIGIGAADLEFAGEVAVPVDATDYAPFAAALESTGADSVVMVQSEQPLSLSLQAMQQAGIRDDFLVGVPVDAFTQDTINSLGPAITDGIVAAGQFPPVTATEQFPELEQYTAEMDAAEEAGVPDADLRRHGNMRPWLAVHVVAHLLEGSEAVDGPSLLAALNAAEDITVPFIESWTPSATVSSQFPRVSNPAVFFQKWEGLELMLLDPEPFPAFEALGIAD